MSEDKFEPARQDCKRPDESSAPLTEAEQAGQKPIHKMFFYPDMDADAIADIIWATRNTDT
jgi:hypothetical protein